MALGLAIAALVALERRRRQLAKTTLLGPWGWSVAALLVLAGAVLAGQFVPPGAEHLWEASLRFAAAVGTFAPAVSLLGAKRPQDRAWQLIVLALWLMLALPAAGALWLPLAGRMEVRDLEAWFLWALIGVGVLNALPTRYWHGAVARGAGQVCLLSGHLPLVRIEAGWYGAQAGLALYALGILLDGCAWPRRAAAPDGPAAASWNAVWRDFRDQFGALWALRVLERVNDAARRYGWQAELAWDGFHPASRQGGDPRGADETPSACEEEQLARTLAALLRRFVSDAWIARRRGAAITRHQEQPYDDSRAVRIG